MLNNKGQSLVLFVVIIPILLGVAILVIDVGNVYLEQNKLKNIIDLAIDTGLDSFLQESAEEASSMDLQGEKKQEEMLEMDESNRLKEELQTLIYLNNPDIDSVITVENEIITINSNTYVKGIFTNLLNIKGFEIKIERVGYLKENKKIIEEKKRG